MICFCFMVFRFEIEIFPTVYIRHSTCHTQKTVRRVPLSHLFFNWTIQITTCGIVQGVQGSPIDTMCAFGSSVASTSR